MEMTLFLCAMCQCFSVCQSEGNYSNMSLRCVSGETVWQSNFRHSHFGTFQKRSYFYFPEICSTSKIKFSFSYGLYIFVQNSTQMESQQSNTNFKQVGSKSTETQASGVHFVIILRSACLYFAFPPFSRQITTTTCGIKRVDLPPSQL